MIASTPEPPYWVVVFTSQRADGGDAEYADTAARMEELAAEQPGFLGIESARSPGGLGITVSYWDSREAVEAWRANAEHLVAQRRGRDEWYVDYAVRVGRVERERRMPRQ